MYIEVQIKLREDISQTEIFNSWSGGALQFDLEMESDEILIFRRLQAEEQLLKRIQKMYLEGRKLIEYGF